MGRCGAWRLKAAGIGSTTDGLAERQQGSDGEFGFPATLVKLSDQLLGLRARAFDQADQGDR